MATTAQRNNAFYHALCPHCQTQQKISYHHIVTQQGVLSCISCEGGFPANGNLLKPPAAEKKAVVEVQPEEAASPIHVDNRVANILAKVKAQASEPIAPQSLNQQPVQVKVLKKSGLFGRFLNKEDKKNTPTEPPLNLEIVQEDNSVLIPYSAISAETEALTQKYLKKNIPDGTKAPVFDLIYRDFNMLDGNGQNQRVIIASGQHYLANEEHNPNKAHSNDFNWTIASFTALIVLILQVFYIVLQK